MNLEFTDLSLETKEAVETVAAWHRDVEHTLSTETAVTRDGPEPSSNSEGTSFVEIRPSLAMPLRGSNVELQLEGDAAGRAYTTPAPVGLHQASGHLTPPHSVLDRSQYRATAQVRWALLPTLTIGMNGRFGADNWSANLIPVLVSQSDGYLGEILVRPDTRSGAVTLGTEWTPNPQILLSGTLGIGMLDADDASVFQYNENLETPYYTGSIEFDDIWPNNFRNDLDPGLDSVLGGEELSWSPSSNHHFRLRYRGNLIPPPSAIIVPSMMAPFSIPANCREDLTYSPTIGSAKTCTTGRSTVWTGFIRENLLFPGTCGAGSR